MQTVGAYKIAPAGYQEAQRTLVARTNSWLVETRAPDGYRKHDLT